MTHPRLLPYYLAQGVAMGSLASVITLLGDFRDDFGLTETQVGLIVGVGFFAAFVTQLTLGRLADRGHAPAMVRFGMLAAAASLVGFALSSSFLGFMSARAMLGVAIGLVQPAIRRTVILADPEQTGRNLGRLGVSEIVGFATAPAIAAILADAFSLDTPFYAFAAVTIVLVSAMGGLEGDAGARAETSVGPLTLLRQPVVVGTLVLVNSQFMMIGAWEAVWSVSLTDLGSETWEIGLSFTLFAIPLAAMAPVAGRRAQRTGGLGLCVGGLGFSCVLAVSLGILDSYWGLVAASMVMGVGAGLGFTAGLYTYARTVPDDRQATAQGLLGATEVLFGGVAAVMGAWLYDLSGRGLVWTVMPALAATVLMSGLLLRRSGERATGPRAALAETS